jgi:hypothetical protein
MPNSSATIPIANQAVDRVSSAKSNRAELWASLRSVIIAGIAFVLTAAVWEIIGNTLHVRPEIAEPFATKINYCFSTDSYDTIFVGSSHLKHGIDPAIFDAETGRLGVETHSFMMGFDGMNYAELQFIVEHLLADPRSRMKTIVIEPIFRDYFVPGLILSQRALSLNDLGGTSRALSVMLHAGVKPRLKFYWVYKESRVAAVRLSNIGAFSNRYITPEEPAPDLEDLLGPARDGYLPLDTRSPLAAEVTSQGIARMVLNQTQAERNGTAHRLNDFELEQLNSLQRDAAAHGVNLVMVVAMTAAPDVLDDYSAVEHAVDDGRISAPLLFFADPVRYPDLYDPAGFTDPDHVGRAASRKFSVRAAQAFVRLPLVVSHVGSVTTPRQRATTAAAGGTH